MGAAKEVLDSISSARHDLGADDGASEMPDNTTSARYDLGAEHDAPATLAG
jgi:hypothetical protein